jgi:Ca2+-binding EF-hand superfamily protein
MGKGKMGKGSAGAFSEAQVEMYRECFKLMDIDKDGVINKNDLRAAFDNVGSLMSEAELDSMLAEVGGTCNFDNMLKCFEVKMTGEGMANDGDDILLEALKSYDETVVEEDKKKNIIIRHLTDPNQFKHVLMTFNDKLNAEEIEDMFDEFEYDDDKMILTKSIVDLFIAGGMDEKKEEEKKEEAAADDAAAGGDGGAGDKGKKKKKKKEKKKNRKEDKRTS